MRVDSRAERIPYTPEQIEVVDRRIRKTCHPKQADFVFDTARRVSLLTGRGAGKTTGELMRMIRVMVRRTTNCVYIAATKDSAERLAWNDLKRLEDILGLGAGIRGFNETKKTLRLPNGSTLLLFGCDDKNDIQKLRGTTWHEVAIDEVASIKKELLFELLHEVLGPRMVGTIVVLGTPGKTLAGMFYDATRPGSEEHRPYSDRDSLEYANWIKWSSHSWNIKDGVDAGIAPMVELYREQLLTKEREGYSDDNPFWLREYLGVWASDGSANVYIYSAHRKLESGVTVEWNQWTPKMGHDGFAILPDHIKDWGYGIGIDVGFKDAFAMEVFAFSYSDPARTLYHVYEVYRTRLGVRDFAKIFIGEDLNHNRYGGVVGAIGWPDILVGDFAGSGEFFMNELREYGITVAAADKPYKYKENAIELVNSDLHEGRIKMMNGSKVEGEMLSLQWVVDTYGKRQENKNQANHGCDAATYLRVAIASMLPSATADAPAAKQRREDDDDGFRVKEPEYGNADAMYANEAW